MQLVSDFNLWVNQPRPAPDHRHCIALHCRPQALQAATARRLSPPNCTPHHYWCGTLSCHCNVQGTLQWQGSTLCKFDTHCHCLALLLLIKVLKLCITHCKIANGKLTKYAEERLMKVGERGADCTSAQEVEVLQRHSAILQSTVSDGQAPSTFKGRWEILRGGGVL